MFENLSTTEIISKFYNKEDETYRCLYCNKYPKFTDRSKYNLKQHMIRKHQKQNAFSTTKLTIEPNPLTENSIIISETNLDENNFYPLFKPKGEVYKDLFVETLYPYQS